MNLTLWISLSIILLSLAVYIFGLVKNNKYIISGSEAVLIGVIGFAIISLLQKYLPDSIHILKVTTVALISAFLSCLFLMFEHHKFCKIIGYLFMTFSMYSWINLYGSTFLIYKVLNSQKLIALSIYISIFLIIAIVIRKQKLIRILSALIYYIPVAFLNFSAFISIQGSRRAYSYTLAAGTILLILLVIFQILKESKLIKIKEQILKLIRTVLLVSSEILITTSGLLMII